MYMPYTETIRFDCVIAFRPCTNALNSVFLFVAIQTN